MHGQKNIKFILHDRCYYCDSVVGGVGQLSVFSIIITVRILLV